VVENLETPSFAYTLLNSLTKLSVVYEQFIISFRKLVGVHDSIGSLGFGDPFFEGPTCLVSLFWSVY